MNSLKIRRYLGYDCNSVDGFNNGHYIDDSPMEARDYEHALQLCREALSEYLGYEVTEENSEDISHGDGPVVEVITGHYNSETGERLTEEQINALDGDEYDQGFVHYRYVYVSAENAE